MLSGEIMAKPKKYDYPEIEYSYYDMDLCLQKDRILELLSLSTPKKVLRFNSKGSYWGFCEYANTYHLVINGGILHFTTYVDSFSDVINFFDELMHSNNKTLICPFKAEIELIKDYIKNETSDCRWLGCYINLVSDNNLYTFEYNYSEKDELIENLNRIKNGDAFRFFLGRLEGDKRMHVWQKENGYIKILYQETTGSSMKKDTDIFRLIVKKEDFVNAFLSAISSVEDEINEVKKSIKNLNNA